jgi:hypothetical protein
LSWALGTGFLKKNRKTVFADGLCQGRSAQNFSKKGKQSLPTAYARGFRHNIF